MKKRFAKRTLHQYLLSKLPENLSPYKAFKRQDKLRVFRGQRVNERDEGLVATAAREGIKIKQVGGYNQAARWSEIDTLEEGPRAPNPNTGVSDIHSYREVSSTSDRVDSLTSALQLKGGSLGQHRGRSSPLLQQITERRKIRILYGNLSNKEVETLVRSAIPLRGEKFGNMFKLLESRLDVVLYRANLFPSIKIAQQWIRRGALVVNGRIETLGARRLSPGDVVKPTTSFLPALYTFLTKRFERTHLNQGTSKTTPALTTSPLSALQTNVPTIDHTEKQREVVVAQGSLSECSGKPTHIEVSYRTLSVVYLCHAQSILLPSTLDMSQVQRGYAR